ncbi:YidC family membrane integrase SpoIIIJ [Fervidibacillus halotolerans]|uniref:Membrane protein insertase YidC n=1 Tax=Fervidibacillus halotolerans TaxID=2980027 RepID=A0A9E8LYY0_9BACI|nr:YidC family membrane integrase SpoIIIJ [Fervidibacillus halotolerans]WAA12295.1 YidC family membrane integrase SpoIIIJ [Fervidibacillus halotolerans]
MRKKLVFILGLIFLVTFLSGCTEINEPITKDSEGIWNQFFVYPLSWLIINTAQLFGGDWGFGMAIILITILIRFAILPIMIKQMKSMKAMQLIQPELEKLKKKYSSKDAITQKKFQQEQMLLLQKYDVNPMAGCLPIFIQMPILIGFYHAIMRTEEIQGHSFLWFELAEPDRFFILPILASVMTFVQQKITMKGQKNSNPQMQIFLWLMPIMIFIFALYLPSALPLYWIVGNIFSIVQLFFIKTPEIPSLQKATTARSGGKKR